MTGIVVVPAGDAIVFATDGAIYDPTTGFLIGSCSKVALIPECSCVITQRGAAGFLQDVHSRLAGRRDYDAILQDAVEVCREVTALYAAHYKFDPIWSMTICGWSNERSQLEIYALRSREYHMRNEMTGMFDIVPPMTLYPIEAILSSPMPSLELRQKFGVNLENLDGQDAINISVRLLCAARFSTAPDETSTEADFNFNIGCFVQLTVLQRDRIESRIVHRWPDRVGEKIDPTRGDSLPKFLHP
jgi:hypothetical protein